MGGVEFGGAGFRKKESIDLFRWRLNPELCIGCRVCVVGCGQDAVKLSRRERSTPFKTRFELCRKIDAEDHEG